MNDLPATPCHIFVTGTGTGVGKTVASAALTHGLRQLGKPAAYWKPVQTGVSTTDAAADDTTFIHHQAPTVFCAPPDWVYALPAAPDQAAAHESRPAVDLASLVSAFDRLPPAFWIVEGAGGLYVPLNDTSVTWADFARQTQLPVLVVAHSGLGTLNHTILTVESLRREGIDVVGVVLSGPRHEANEKSLRRLLPNLPLTALPDLPGFARNPAWNQAAVALATWTIEALAKLSPPSAMWEQYDRDHCWHPYTQHQTAPAPLPVVRAEGAWLTLANGQRVLDGVSSWWVNTLGHARPEVVRALSQQAARLDHVLFAGLTHEPAARLAHQLTQLAGPPLKRVFFSDNGSTAVEIALKMAYQAFVQRGQRQRQTFLAFRGSYHGDTFGTMAVAAADEFHHVFRPFLFRARWADPVTIHPSAVCPDGAEALSPRLEALEKLLHQEHETLAGVVIEPLLQGAGGMLVQPAAFLQGIERLCRHYGLPLILDEVFTGLGRVGAAFAFQRAGIVPDLVCLAKGLTGGTLPLAVTLATETLFEAFLSEDRTEALLHGHSYTANAIACQAALASLEIFTRADVPARALALEGRFQQWLQNAGARLGVRHGRALGGVLAFEMPPSPFIGEKEGYFAGDPARVQREALTRGLLVRPLGTTVYLAPPLLTPPADIELALTALTDTLTVIEQL